MAIIVMKVPSHSVTVIFPRKVIRREIAITARPISSRPECAAELRARERRVGQPIERAGQWRHGADSGDAREFRRRMSRSHVDSSAMERCRDDGARIPEQGLGAREHSRNPGSDLQDRVTGLLAGRGRREAVTIFPIQFARVALALTS